MKVKVELLFDTNCESDIADFHAIAAVIGKPPTNLNMTDDGQMKVAVYTNDDPAKAQEALDNMTLVPNAVPVTPQNYYAAPVAPPQYVEPPAAPAAPAVAPQVAPAPPAVDFKQSVKAAVAQAPPTPPPAAPAPATNGSAGIGQRLRQLLAEAAKLPEYSPEIAKQQAMAAAGVPFAQMTPQHAQLAIGALEQLLAAHGAGVPAAPVAPPQPAAIQPPAPITPQASDLLV